MNGIDVITNMFQYTFVQNGLIGGIAAALLCAVLGVFIVLRRTSLIGEGVAHLSFGGIAIGLFAGIYPMYTALTLSLFGTMAIAYLQKRKYVYSETAIGILFSFGLAIGAVVASLGGGFSVDLFSYLWGDILTISEQDLKFILILAAIVLTFVLIFYKEMMHLTFDEQGCRILGVPVLLFDIIFNVMVALTVVVSIKIVGSLLVSSLLILPAATALQLSRSFSSTMVLSIIFGMVSVISGLFLSFFYDIATGGAIVLISIGIFTGFVMLRKFIIRQDEGTTEDM